MIDSHDKAYDRSGNFASTILIDGGVVGVWNFEKPESTVKSYLLEKVEDGIMDMICNNADYVGLFLANRKVKVRMRFHGFINRENCWRSDVSFQRLLKPKM